MDVTIFSDLMFMIWESAINQTSIDSLFSHIICVFQILIGENVKTSVPSFQ